MYLLEFNGNCCLYSYCVCHLYYHSFLSLVTTALDDSFLTVYTPAAWPVPISSHCQALAGSPERKRIPEATGIPEAAGIPEATGCSLRLGLEVASVPYWLYGSGDSWSLCYVIKIF